MKNIYLIFGITLFIFGLLKTEKVNSQACCPDFILKDAVEICAPQGSCTSDPIGMHRAMAACKNSLHTYTVYPNDPSFTYTWTVTGGTPGTFTGNPNTILWGNGATGFIKVVITSNNPSLNCKDSILQEICLIDGPQAALSLNPDTVCVNTPVNFTNLSVGGSVFTWDMGDGTIYSGPVAPPHSYSAPGTYTVLLTVKDMGAGQYIGGSNGETKIPCGCADTATAVVVVLPGTGPEIVTDCCYGTVCPSDTSEFCTPMVCSTYTWSVTGGTIVSGAGTNCIKVKWNATYSVPTTVTLQSCPSSSCPGSTTINVPVLYPNLPINGPTVICAGGSGSFSLPHLPGTFYKWTVTGGFHLFNEKNRNVSLVNISFFTPGTYWVKCETNNPLAGCSGVDSLQVNVLPKFDIVGPDKVCEGDPTFFSTNSPIGGPPANWTFAPAGPTVLSGQGTPNVSISWTPGNYVLTATSLAPPTHCNLTATKNITVVAKPILGNISGAVMACPNSNYTYSITSNTSGSPFIWSVSTGVIMSEMGDDNDSVVVQFTGPGPWTIQVYQEIDLGNSTYCQSLTKTLNVNPFPQPTISGNSPVCVDAVETYAVSGPVPPGGFQWSISPSINGTILSGQGSTSVSIKWHGPATTAIITVNSCSGNDTHPVVINDPPIASISPNGTPVFCLGDVQTLILSAVNNAGYSFQWYDGNGILTGQTGPNLSLNIASFTNPGTFTYYVIVTVNGCSAKSNLVNVVIEDCTLGGSGGGPGPGGCDVVSFFRTYAVCDQVTLINKSYAIAPASITGYSWSLSPATGSFLPNNTSPNPLLVVTASGLYAITLTVTSSTGCVSTWTEFVNILLPVASYNLTSPVCENVPATFTAIPNNPNYSYFWSFGDGSTSYTPVTQHAYASAALSPYFVNLVITDQYGCIATMLDTITVNPTPACTITASDTAYCPGGFVTLTACSGMSSYQWYKDSTLLAGDTSQTLNVGQYGEYWVEITNIYGCSSISNKIFIYQHKKPKADITGEGYICAIPGSQTSFGLSTIFDPDYIYNWTCLPGGATFSPPNSNAPWVTLNLPFTLPAYFQFIVDVTDTVTGCTNSDTLCVAVYETPALSIVSIPALDICEGTPVTLIPNLNNTSLYSYMWSNGMTTPVITVSTPGFYSLTITNKATGCSATANAGNIHPKPDLSLFPIGCDQLCDPDSLYLYIPLPLNAMPPFNTVAAAYPVITWLDNGVPVGTGPTLTFPAGTSGNHQFSVAVTNNFGCVDTAGVFCLTNGCCNIALEYLEPTPATCAQTADGSFTIVLDPASSGGPFTITSIPIVPPFPTTIIPGNPLTVNNLPPGTYTIVINGPTEGCSETFTVDIGFLQEDCCFAEMDSLFVKIYSDPAYTSDVVWDGKYYIDDNVIVTVSNGAVLDITNVDVVFGECAGILFTGGAMLRSNNSVYRPCEVDQTWKGLRFVGKGEFDNIVNECTFKNAEVALYFQENADAVISSNLFSNCNYGVRVEGNNNFFHPISGNRFVTEQFFPLWDCPTKYGFINNSSTYGIYSTSSRFRQQLSHNEFINTWGSAAPKTHGIYQINGGGTFSNNTFTDLSYAIFLNTQQFTTIIENNEIELNEPVNSTLAAIYLNTCTSPVIEINNNEISDNLHQFSCFSAIYLRNSAKISVMFNKINGFNYGIFASGVRNVQVSSNEIIESEITGIYFAGKGNFPNFITCNNVKMRSFNNTRGIYTLDLTPLSEIHSNCINDCNTSMDIRALTGGTLPKIRNNFLYNYNFVGINVVGYSGSIGTLSPPDPGLNTLWSNFNPAIDINSSANITVADNFGMFNISWPTVQITSNRPFHSTASCAQQIFNMPSQGNLNVNYLCDNYKNLFTAINGAGGLFSLPSDYKARLSASADQYFDAELIMASIEPAGEALLQDVLASTSLSGNETALLKYHHYYRHEDYLNARMALNAFIPENASEEDFKALRRIDLNILDYGWDALTREEVSLLEQISSESTEHSNFAISLLNNSPAYRDHIFEEVVMPDVLAGAEIKHVQAEDYALVIHPNPANDKVMIEYVDYSLADNIVRVFDASGKQVTRFTLSSSASGIELGISSLNEGFYFVTVTDKGTGTVKTGKLIKVNQSK